MSCRLVGGARAMVGNSGLQTAESRGLTLRTMDRAAVRAESAMSCRLVGGARAMVGNSGLLTSLSEVWRPENGPGRHDAGTQGC
jgi:hypothetical protein